MTTQTEAVAHDIDPHEPRPFRVPVSEQLGCDLPGPVCVPSFIGRQKGRPRNVERIEGDPPSAKLDLPELGVCQAPRAVRTVSILAHPMILPPRPEIGAEPAAAAGGSAVGPQDRGEHDGKVSAGSDLALGGNPVVKAVTITRD